MKTETEKPAALARRVYETIYHGTESFEGIGAHVAYLVGGILTEASGVEFFEPLEEPEQEFIELLQDLFEDDDSLWQFVRLVPSDGET